MSNGDMVTRRQIVMAQEELEHRCVFMLQCGQSYKSIAETLGLTHNQIAGIRQRCGISAWEFRNGGGALGTVVCARAKFTPTDDIKKLASQIKQLPAAK
jgi:hypothetical protein